MIDLILIHGFLHSLLRSLLRCFFFCLLDERDNINNHRHIVVEIEDGVLAELGELCHEPTADGSIARGQREATAFFQEKVGLHIIFAVGKAIDEALHILVFEVLKLITVKGFARALGNILSGGLVGLVDNLHLGEILFDLRDRLILGGGGVIHLLGEVCGNGDGAGGKINLVAFQFYILLFP